MAFLIKDELVTVADIELIDILSGIDNADTVVAAIIAESIDIMKGFLSRFYDIDAIFSATGTARKLSVLKRLKDIVIYEIYERHTRETNAVAARRYNEAMDWLEKCYTGELGDRTLPPKPTTPENTAGTAGDVQFGGNIRYSSKY